MKLTMQITYLKKRDVNEDDSADNLGALCLIPQN